MNIPLTLLHPLSDGGSLLLNHLILGAVMNRCKEDSGDFAVAAVRVNPAVIDLGEDELINGIRELLSNAVVESFDGGTSFTSLISRVAFGEAPRTITVDLDLRALSALIPGYDDGLK